MKHINYYVEEKLMKIITVLLLQISIVHSFIMFQGRWDSHSEYVLKFQRKRENIKKNLLIEKGHHIPNKEIFPVVLWYLNILSFRILEINSWCTRKYNFPILSK